MNNLSATNEIAIVGGGPIGLACALAAAQLRATNITLIERQTLALAQLSSHFDHRVYAISPGSRALLESLGVWSRMIKSRIEPVRAMQVFGEAFSSASAESAEGTERAEKSRGEIEFEEGMPLAYIVEYAALMQALIGTVHERIQEQENIRVFDNMQVSAIEFANAEETNNANQTNKITLQDGVSIQANLLIAADGAASPMRALAGIAAQTKDYESDGVVANFMTEKPHHSIARQWFTDDGVLAYLPLPGNTISVVYSVGKSRADELSAQSDQGFADAVAKAGEYSLGALKLISARARFPLKRVMAQKWVLPGFALVGDAAHAIHPLAGQGANLGFADVCTLCDVLSRRSALSGIGDYALLRQYERARREDALMMGGVTDNLRSLFLSESTLVKRLRRDGMNAVNQMGIVKTLMMSHAMK